MRKVLIITYYWPPSGGAGVQRWLKFTKYLPEFGWHPVVITVKNGTYPHLDPTLEDDVSGEVTVHRTKTLEPFGIYNKLLLKKDKSVSAGLTGIRDSKNPVQRLSKYIRANVFVPDARRGWNHFAYKKAAEVIENEKIDLVVTTGPPHSTHLTGLKLKKNYDLPWLADFRDPWTGVYYNKFLPRTSATERKDKRMEDEVLSAADVVTVVGEKFKDEFPDHKDKIRVVYNGYDESDITNMAEEEPVTDHFTLSYIGNFKPNQDVPVLWQVLNELMEEDEMFRQHFQLQFVGKIDDHICEKINATSLEKALQLKGFVSHPEAVQLMNAANLLLFVIPRIDTNQLIITGKIFEYLASNSAILSIGPVDGDAARILEQCHRDSMIGYEEASEMKQQILNYFRKWQEFRKAYKHADDSYRSFNRRNQTERLSEIMKKMNHATN